MASMILVDVNILVYAKRPDAPNHFKFRSWVVRTLLSEKIISVSRSWR